MNEFNVKEQSGGAYGDGVHDDTAPIQAAINAAQTAGGGSVVFPVGTYKITATLTVTHSNVRLIGQGAGGVFSSQPSDPASSLLWQGGAGTALLVTSVASSGKTISNCGVSGLGIFNTNSTGTRGLVVDTAAHGSYEGLVIEGFVTNNLAVQSTVVTGDAIGAQDNVFQRIRIDTSGSGDGMYMDNASLNLFHSMRVQHANGNGLTIAHGDFNTFTNITMGRSSTGTGVGVALGPGGNGALVYSNFFTTLSAGQGGVHAYSGSFNTILQYDSADNAAPNPTVDTGAALFWTADNGGMNNWRPTVLNFFSNTDGGVGFQGIADPAHPYIANDNNGPVRGLIVNVPTNSTSGVRFTTNASPNGASVQADGSIAAKYYLVGAYGQSLTAGDGAPAFGASVPTIYMNRTGSSGSLLYVNHSSTASAGSWTAFA